MTSSPPRQLAWYERFWAVSLAMLVCSVLLISAHYAFEAAASEVTQTTTDTKIQDQPNATNSHAKSVSHGATETVLHIAGIICKEAGFAVLIAFFLNLSVEWVNRRRHADQEANLISAIDGKHETRSNELVSQLNQKYETTSTALLQNVFKTVYERNIDPSVFRQIEKHILKKDFMRTGYSVALEISLIESQQPMVELRLCISYKVKNLTDRVINVPLLVALIDIDPLHKEKCYFARASIDKKELLSEELKSATEELNDGKLRSLKVPGEVNPGDYVEVQLEYCKVAPVECSEAFCTTTQMDGLELQVTNPNLDLDIDVASLHPEDAVVVSQRGERYTTRWKVDHAILPGQGAVLFWHPKRLQQSTSVSTGSSAAESDLNTVLPLQPSH